MTSEAQRERIERALGSEGCRWLDWWMNARDLPRHKWQCFPSIRQEVEQTAAMLLAVQLQIESGGALKWRPALNDAAARLHLSPDAILRRHDRDVSRRFPSEPSEKAA